jgi:hypothetical protein
MIQGKPRKLFFSGALYPIYLCEEILTPFDSVSFRRLYYLRHKYPMCKVLEKRGKSKTGKLHKMQLQVSRCQAPIIDRLLME